MLLVVLLVTVWAAGGQRAAPTGDGGTDATRLGPFPSEDVGAYLARTRDVAPGPGPRLALVGFDAALPPAAAAASTAGVGVTVLQAVFRVPLPRVQTALRREDLPSAADTGGAGTTAGGPTTAAAMTSVLDAARLRAAADARADAGAAPPGRARDVAAAEAERLAAPCACVIALVVRGDVGPLSALARGPGVRVVEVAAPGASTARLAVSPLLPDQGAGRPLGPVVGPVPDDGPIG